MKAYLLVAFLANSLMTWVDEGSMARDVRMGRIATDLARPIDFQARRPAEALGPFLVELLSTLLVGVDVIVAFGGMAVPSDPVPLALFVVSKALATLLKFTIVYCVSMTASWTMGMYGIRIGRAAIQNLSSGALFPLAFFPDWLRTVAAVLPVQWGVGRRSRGCAVLDQPELAVSPARHSLVGQAGAEALLEGGRRGGAVQAVEPQEGGAHDRRDGQTADLGRGRDCGDAGADAFEKERILGSEHATGQDHVGVQTLHLEPADGRAGPGHDLVREAIDDAARYLVAPGGGREDKRRDLDVALVGYAPAIDGHAQRSGAGHAEVGRHRPLQDRGGAAAVLRPDRRRQTREPHAAAAAPVTGDFAQGVEAGDAAVRGDAQAVHAAAADHAHSPGPVRARPQTAVAVVHDQIGRGKTRAAQLRGEKPLVARQIDPGRAVRRQLSGRSRGRIQARQRASPFHERDKRGEAPLGAHRLMRGRGPADGAQHRPVRVDEGNVRLGVAHVDGQNRW